MSNWEKVHTVEDADRLPIWGAADCEGKPHLYEREFSVTNDDYTENFHVMEIDRDLLCLLVERFQIFLRWRSAFDTRATTLDTHPALLDDKMRHAALNAAIGGRDRLLQEKSRLMRPRFKRFSEFEFEVMWDAVDEELRSE